MKKMWLGLLLVLPFLNGFAATPNPSTLYQWVEYAPNNHVDVRVLTTQATCPQVMVNTQPQSMQMLYTGNKHFPVNVCQLTLPTNTTYVSIAGKKLALPKANPTKIVIFGDTGCRIKKGVNPQDCDDPQKWPFPVVAKTAAAWKPDVVIHVGDYLYRESSCPPGDKGCQGSPHGDNWVTWDADFFKAAKPLLQVAPWIFVRGNHEICERAGDGWTRLLDPFAFKHCHDYSPIYGVDLGDTRVFIMDSANANDLVAPSDQVTWYENYLRVIENSTAKHNWIITHKPFWFEFESEANVVGSLQSHLFNTLQTAWDDVSLSNVDLLLSGHVHRFESLSFNKAANRPPQLVVGTGGTRLDKNDIPTDLTGVNVAGDAVSQGLALSDFGFVTLEKQANGEWKAQLRSPYGRILARCVLRNELLDCERTKRSYQ